MVNGYYIIGEIQNNTNTPMASVEVTAIYEYKPNGRPIATLGTEKTSTLLDIIHPNGKVPFKLGPYVFSEPVTMYELKVQGQAGTLQRQDLVLQSSNSSSAGTWLYVRGEIKNTGSANAQYVKAVITLYDPKGSVISILSTFHELPILF